MKRRNTVRRTLTLEAVRRLRRHATADEVHAAIAQEHPTISRATVYRNLNQLAQSGEILKLEVPDGPDRYDHQRHRHYHARCTRCGQVMDVDLPYLEGLEKAIRDGRGFEFAGHDILFKGICAACKRECSFHAGE